MGKNLRYNNIGVPIYTINEDNHLPCLCMSIHVGKRIREIVSIIAFVALSTAAVIKLAEYTDSPINLTTASSLIIATCKFIIISWYNLNT